jgi:hypothetical protein
MSRWPDGTENALEFAFDHRVNSIQDAPCGEEGDAVRLRADVSVSAIEDGFPGETAAFDRL